MLSNPRKPVTIYSVPVIIGKSFSMESMKQNTEKGFRVTGIYPLNANDNQVGESANAPSSSKDNNEEGTSA